MIKTSNTTLNPNFEFLAMAFRLFSKFIQDSERALEPGATCTLVTLPDRRPCSQIPVLSFLKQINKNVPKGKSNLIGTFHIGTLRKVHFITCSLRNMVKKSRAYRRFILRQLGHLP